MSQRTLYYFAVGGTGALSVEPLLHLCAAGLGPERLAIVLIDPDAGNPAFGRASTLLETYDAVRKAFGKPSTGYFRTELIRTARKDSVWSPLGTGDLQTSADFTLDSYVERARMDGESLGARAYFDLLFSPVQQTEKLKEGFRGNPAIGSIMMHGLRDTQLFKELLNAAKGDTNGRFFATGSIFGGTGASALPVLAKLLSDAGITSDRIGAALVTPYYALGEPGADEQRDGRLKPDSAKFLSATAAALPTYLHGSTKFGALYVMGDEQSMAKARKTYSAGGSDQLNDPHFIELYAALAALDFAEHVREGMLYATVSGDEPSWVDLTISERERAGLRGFLLAGNFFLQYFGVTRGSARELELEGELRKMPWLQDVGLKSEFVRTHAGELNLLGRWFEALWGWSWATAHNYRPLRLVSFDLQSPVRLRLPESYASEGEVRLPILEQTFHGFNAKRDSSFFRKGDARRLASLAEMFHWYHALNDREGRGMTGFLQHLRRGSEAFVNEWYTPVARAERTPR